MVKKMVKVTLEKQGRVLLPKKIRDQLNMRIGEELQLEVRDMKVVLQPAHDLKEFSAQLKGCIKKSSINPLELKKIWRM